MNPLSRPLTRCLESGLVFSLSLAGQVFAANPDLLFIAQPQGGSGAIATTETVLADVNHDGKPDLLRTVNGNALGVQLGQGNGVFGSVTAYAAGTQATGVRVADLNRDGNPDVLITNLNDKTVGVFLGNSDGTFQPQIVTNPGLVVTDVVITDFDKDGTDDLIMTGYPTSPVEGYVYTMTGDGAGHFGNLHTMPVSGRTYFMATRGVAAGDLNGDGYPDFVTSSPGGGGAISSFLNNKNGTFTLQTEMIVTANVGRVVVADFNRDGKLDLASIEANDTTFGNTNAGQNIGVAMGRGDGYFDPIRPFNDFYVLDYTVYGGGATEDTYVNPGANPIAADLDGDGLLDLAFCAKSASTLANYVAILRGKGDGTFVFGNRFDAEGNWISTADLNNDGAPDILTTGNNASFFTYLTGAITPGFTTPDTTRFISGASSSFTVKAVGNPAPVFSETGTLPAGISFSTSGVLSGTPAAGSEGVYPITIKAQNSVGQSATQAFTLTVSAPGLVVTTATDEDNGSTDPLLGTGTSLREAVNLANTLTGTQTITFAPSLAGATISLTQTAANSTGDPSALICQGNLIIQGLTTGQGVTIQRGSSGSLRLFKVDSNKSLTLNDLTLAGGISQSGGAIWNAGTLRANRCLFRDNQATLSGGAIYSGSSSSQTLVMNHCTLTANQGAFGGSAIANNNSTSTATLTHVTIARNMLSNAGASGGALEGGLAITLVNSIVIGNTKTGRSDYYNIANTLNTGSHHNMIGYSYSETASDGGLVNGVNGNITKVTQDYLWDLADNGGPTRTMALESASPAINSAAAVAGMTTDQRGIPRGLRTGGLLGRYYHLTSDATTALLSPISNLDALIPGAAAVSPRIDFGAGTESTPGDGSVLDRGGSGGNPFASLGVDVGSDNIAAQWTGFITAPQTADYRFTLRSDDGSVLYIDDALVVNNNNLQPMTNASGTVHLGAGLHRIRVGYIEAAGDSGMQLSWEQLNGSAPFGRRIVSPDVLSYGSAPDMGAYEDAGGDEDPDRDGVSNATEQLSSSRPLLIDTDNDGFNDATEIMAGSNCNNVDSTPPATHVERVLGYGPGRGLDLSGNFPYAFSVGSGAATGKAGDAQFTADTAAGISISAGADIGLWTGRRFGTTADDQTLANVLGSIRWSNRNDSDPSKRTLKVDLANVAAEKNYKLQLLFADAQAYDRVFDIAVNGSNIMTGFNTNTAQGANSAAYAASAVVHSFTSPGNTVHIELSGANSPGTVDGNPILNAVTLEEIPTVAGAPVFTTPAGTYDNSVSVGLSTPAVGTTIRYTTDGSTPSESVGTVYTAPFTLETSATVRAIATGGGWLASGVSSASYTVLAPLASWRNLQGLPANGSQDLATPAGDGIANLLKYAFNMAPTAGSLAVPNVAVLPAGGTAGLPAITADAQGHLVIRFVRRKAATNPGLTYTVETGASLTSFQTMDLSGATVESIDATWERVTVTDPTLTPNRFGRVRVTGL